MRPPGATVRLRYRTPEVVTEGDFIVSAATGRSYVVEEARPRKQRDGYNLLCVVLPPDAEVEGDIHWMWWDSR